MSDPRVMTTLHNEIGDEARKDANAILNTLPPVELLFPELLAEIFLLCVVGWYYAETEPSHDDLSNRYSFSRVCRRWRTLALGCPMLWSLVSFDGKPELISSLLARTKKAPLSIKVMPWVTTVGKLPILEKLLAEESERIYELGLSLSFVAALDKSGPLSSLQKVHLELPYQTSDKPSSFSKILFDGAAPDLQYLSLSVLSFIWRSNVHHPHLRHLYLTSRRRAESLNNILAALEGMPLLELLDLRGCLPDELKPAISGSPLLILPHLETIELRSKLEDCINFLSYFQTPSARDITMLGSCSNSKDKLDADLAPITQVAGLKYAQLTYNPTQLTYNPTCCFAFQFATHPSYDDPLAKRVQVLYYCTIRSAIYYAIYDALPLFNLLSFTLEGPVPKKTMTRLFASMPRLQVLQARKCLLVPLLTVLCSQSNMPSREGADQCEVNLLPKLQDLELSAIDLESLRSPYGDQAKWQCRLDCSRTLKIERIVYGKDCVNLNAETAALLREATGAARDNFLDQSSEHVV